MGKVRNRITFRIFTMDFNKFWFYRIEIDGINSIIY